MLSRRKMMNRAKEDFFRKPKRGIEHRQEVKPRVERSEAEARARTQSDKFAETPEAGDGEMQEIDPKQAAKDRAVEFILGAAVGGMVGLVAGKILGAVFPDAYRLVSSLALYGLVFGGGINAMFLHKAPR